MKAKYIFLYVIINWIFSAVCYGQWHINNTNEPSENINNNQVINSNADSIEIKILEINNVTTNTANLSVYVKNHSYEYIDNQGYIQNSYINEMGICFSTSPDPTTRNNKVRSEEYTEWDLAPPINTCDCDENSLCTYKMGGLIPGTTYYVKAYAILNNKVHYGEQLSFQTVFQGVLFDGYNYPSITLRNGQEWLTENLKTDNFANGDPIPNIQDSSEWVNTNSPAWCHYDNDTLYDENYSKLYNWYAVNDQRNICPTGWHVPTVEDVDSLLAYLSKTYQRYEDYNGYYIGTLIKSRSKWKDFILEGKNVGNGSNVTGLNFFPTGGRNSNGIFDHFSLYGYYWLATQKNELSSEIFFLSYDKEHMKFTTLNKHFGISVRCIKN